MRAMAREGAGISALHNNCSGKHAGFLCLGWRPAVNRCAVGANIHIRLGRHRYLTPPAYTKSRKNREIEGT